MNPSNDQQNIGGAGLPSNNTNSDEAHEDKRGAQEDDEDEFDVYDDASAVDSSALFSDEGKLARNWRAMYNLLKEYRDENGHANPPSKEIYKGKLIGRWAGEQRIAYNRRQRNQVGDTKVIDERISLLIDIGFIFTNSRKPDDPFDRWYELLLQYRNEKGHANPKRNEKFKEENLGQWCGDIRYCVNSNRITEMQRALLDDIGFSWDPCNFVGQNEILLKKESWESMFELLKEYRTEYRHVSPTRVETYRGKNIGKWVDWQRVIFFRQHADQPVPLSMKLKDNQIALLNSLGFVWDAAPRHNPATGKKRSRWELMYELLKEYKEEHGHASPLHSETYRGENLGRWVGDNRLAYTKLCKDPNSTRLTGERVAKLKQIGFVWDPKNPQSEPEDPLIDLADLAAGKNVNDHEGEEFPRIDPVSGKKRSRWDFMYALLCEYRREHNSVTPKCSDKYYSMNLGRWVAEQRINYAKRQRGELRPDSTQMTDERIALLREIGFCFEGRKKTIV